MVVCLSHPLPRAWSEHHGVAFTVDALLGRSECQGEASSSTGHESDSQTHL